jgi:hypothetical protein
MEFAYLVIWEHGGLGGAFLRKDRAVEFARHTEGVVVELPIVADFRKADAPEIISLEESV